MCPNEKSEMQKESKNGMGERWPDIKVVQLGGRNGGRALLLSTAVGEAARRKAEEPSHMLILPYPPVYRNDVPREDMRGMTDGCLIE